jgi:hypothetical protein
MQPWAAAFRAGLAEFGEGLTKRYPGVTSISELPEADAIAFLQTVEDTPFFRLCWVLTVWGTFADPAYGGNRDGAGWSMIGFEDRHAWHPPFGYYDADAHGAEE